MKKIIKILPYVLIFLFSFFYIKTIFLSNVLHYGEEQAFINYDFANWRFQNIWVSSINFGNILPAYFVSITLGKIWLLAKILALDLVTTQKLFYYIVISSTAVFSYSLAYEIIKKRLYAVIFSLVYITTYNYYSSIDTSARILQYLILPASLWFWTLFYKTKKIKYLIFNSLFIVSTLSIANNPPQMIGAYIMVLSYIFILYGRISNLRQIIIFSIPYILTLIYVGLVVFLTIRFSSNISGNDPLSIPWSATEGTLRDIFRFFGSWADYQGSGKIIYYNHLFSYYNSFWGIIISNFPFLILLFLIFYKLHKFNGFVLRLLTLLILMIFLTKGTSQPFPMVIDWIYNFKVLSIFREPWAKFIINFIFITYFSSIILLKDVNTCIQKIILVLFIIYLGFQIYPLISQQALDHRYIDWKRNNVQIPQYWLSLSDFSHKGLKDKRVLVLPANNTQANAPVYNWNPYKFKGFPEVLLINSNILTNMGTDRGEAYLMNVFFNAINPQLLKMASIDYVLDQTLDVDKMENSINPKMLMNFLNKEKKMKFGPLALYPVKENIRSPKIRSIQIINYKSNLCSFDSYNSNKDLSAIAFISKKKNLANTVAYTNIGYNKINETTYQIKLKEPVNHSTGLLFMEMFNKGWKLYTSNNPLSSPLRVDHFQANCVGNLWIIPPELTQKYKYLYLKFEPQLFFTTITYTYYFLLIASIILFSLIKNKKLKISDVNKCDLKIAQIFQNNYARYIKKLRIYNALLCAKLTPLFTVIKIVVLIDSYRIISRYLLNPTYSSEQILSVGFAIIGIWIIVGIKSRFIALSAILMHILTIKSILQNNVPAANLYAVWVVVLIIITLLYQLIEFRLRKTDYFKLSFNSIVNLFINITNLLSYIAKYINKLVYYTLPEYIPDKYINLFKKYKLTLKNILKDMYDFSKYVGALATERESIFKIFKKFVSYKRLVIVSGIILLIIVLNIGGILIKKHYDRYISQYRTKLYIMTLAPSMVTPANDLILHGFKFGSKNSELYRVMTEEGPIMEYKAWDNEKIVIIVPLTLNPGKHYIWVERPIDELYAKKGVIRSNKKTILVYDRFLFLPQNANIKERLYKKIKYITFKNSKFLYFHLFDQ